MKIITLNLDEAHNLTDNISIVITQIRGKYAKVGVNAPRDVHILRGELKRQKRPILKLNAA